MLFAFLIRSLFIHSNWLLPSLHKQRSTMESENVLGVQWEKITRSTSIYSKDRGKTSAKKSFNFLLLPYRCIKKHIVISFLYRNCIALLCSPTIAVSCRTPVFFFISFTRFFVCAFSFIFFLLFVFLTFSTIYV